MILVYIDMTYQLLSFMWYAAIILATPTAKFQVPKVRAESGVTGEVGGSTLTIEATEGLRPSGGVMLSSSTVWVMSVVLRFWEGWGGL